MEILLGNITVKKVLYPLLFQVTIIAFLRSAKGFSVFCNVKVLLLMFLVKNHVPEVDEKM